MGQNYLIISPDPFIHPGFVRSPDGKVEIEISTGHPHMGEGPHVKVMQFDPTKGNKGGMRVVEKIFTEDGK